MTENGTKKLNFYPRSPCGERRTARTQKAPSRGFLSTLSLRRATVTVLGIQHRVGISIHALLAESDMLWPVHLARGLDFYPRSPCGERRYLINTYHRIFGISIHALLAESDLYTLTRCASQRLFLSTLSLRRATIDTSKDVIKTTNFYPRSPCGERQFKLWRA